MVHHDPNQMENFEYVAIYWFPRFQQSQKAGIPSTVEEVVSQMPNAKVFSILASSSEFWQVDQTRLQEYQPVHIQHSIWKIHVQQTFI